MDLLWPGFLLLLALIPAFIGLYIWMLRRRRRYAVRFSSLSLVRAALPQQSQWRRYLPFALFLLALAFLVLAVSRPVAIVSVPAGQATIILAMDVSRSMCSTDIPPNRLQAAEAAALRFINDQPASTQIGIVAFAGFAELIQAPTADQELLEDAIFSLRTGRRTGIGNAILEALDALAEIDESIAPTVRTSADLAPTPVPNGAYAPSIIVVLTDGASNVGVEPIDAAQQAVDRGVRVYTIGFGTAQGGSMNCGGLGSNDPFGGGFGGGFGNDPFGGGGGGGGFRRGIDEETLQQVADMTDATYYAPESADELQAVFESLPTSLIMRHETTEISFAFVALGALLAVLALSLALLWNPLP
jgi:Ca-activated chloride channel family protein